MNFPLIKYQIPGGPYEQMRETVRIIGDTIRRGRHYLPIRNHAAALATKAGPKDFLGQVKAIYDDLVSRWRYVKDPIDRELVTIEPAALYQYVIAGDGAGVGLGKGAGDCDDITAAAGALLGSIGFPVRIGTSAPAGAAPGRLFRHVFAQAHVPGVGWITVDPVLHPRRGFGAFPPASRAAFFTLDGRLISKHGNVAGNLSGDTNERGNQMEHFPGLQQWQDYGFSGADDPGAADHSDLLDWREHVLRDFGIYADEMGHIDLDGDYMPGYAVEVDTDEHGLARTPMLELAPNDYRYISTHGRPYPGMLALGDEGQVYVYEGAGAGLGDVGFGFFKKLFKRGKKFARKIGRRVRRGTKKLLKKLPGGKYLIKLGKKVRKIAQKIVRPLAKFVGKYASKLAPVAALIPGYGPAIAAGLYTAGKVAKLMTTYGTKIVGKKGKVRDLKHKSAAAAVRFKQELEREAKKASRGKSKRKKTTRRRKVTRRRAPRRAFARGRRRYARGRRRYARA